MIIEMLTRMADPTGNVSAGTHIDLPDEQAQQLIAGGYAKFIKVTETAQKEELEKVEKIEPKAKKTKATGKKK